mmetsp:Transcript_9667/g.16026  ORF Transcript_9667/g.16026 Transcript_9667/m.16026 type:complete len:555 (+) Transcript_9667:49-1713(+)
MSFSTQNTSKFAVFEFGAGTQPKQASAPKKSKEKKTEDKSTKLASAPNSEGEGKVIENLILTTLSTDEVIPDTWEFSVKHNFDHQAVVGSLKSLLTDLYVTEEVLSVTYYTLTSEAESIVQKGSPEYIVYCNVPVDGISMADLQKAVGNDVCKIGLGPCMKNKTLKKNKDTIIRTDTSKNLEDETAANLKLLQTNSPGVSDDEIKNLKRRKLVNQVVRKSYKVLKGAEYNPVRRKRIADLTKEMFGNKAELPPGTHWSDVGPFKPINLNAMGAPITGGSFHPLLKVRAEFRRILMEMGFEEMPTSKWVESSFWNFDSLFQPQSHPARDAHDTFFMKEPRLANGCPEDYYERVKTTHESGGDTGSTGYGCIFKREETMKNLLRTHTTAISAQMLYKLANQEGGFTPKKYFSIDRVFRNEAMDATHLCEFHQVEGLVADRGLTLGHLIGTIKTFFEKIGITQLRFKPAYNPYTEPSMEIFGYHPELKKWTEIGNSGMFRPEMLLPMGLPSDVRVIAWGLSLERPTMIKYKIENIRDLFGHKAELISQRNAPISRFF